MDVQLKLGGVVKIRFYFGYKIEVLKDNELKFGRSIQRNPNNDTIIYPFLSKI